MGANQAWTGDSNDGATDLHALRSGLGHRLRHDLQQEDLHSTGTLEYVPVQGGTQVVWKMVGDNGNNIMARYFAGLMPSLIGPQFEEGLVRLKLVSERAEMDESPVPES